MEEKDTGEKLYEKSLKEITSNLFEYQSAHNYTNREMSIILNISERNYNHLVSKKSKKRGPYLKTMCNMFANCEIDPAKIFDTKHIND